MIRVRMGEVAEVTERRPGITEVTVVVDGERCAAVNYDGLTGPVRPGNRVILNTTAKYLGLGTGGVHFVMGVVGNETEYTGPGHIMKCRYTPAQAAICAVEEPASPYHGVMQDGDLGGTPVVVATLHSVVPAVAAAAKHRANRDLRVVYVMTDGAALPAAFSRLVAELRERRLIDAVITAGHAFGGDYEAVTVFSALLAARAVCRADLVVVCMGPGVVGTGTTWGTTALEQGTILDAANVLQGRAIAVPRISFADPRERHRGVSHHTLTALGRVAARPCTVALPTLEGEGRALVYRQLAESGILARHRVQEYDGWFVAGLLEELGLRVTTMGRSPREDPAPFAAGAAAALCALEG